MINPRLLRLALFQFGMGFSVVVFSGTLNRVLIKEEGIPAAVVGWLLSLSVFVAPARALFGFRSDRERKTFGYRRLPYFWIGMMMIFAGLSAGPFSLLVLSRSFDLRVDLPFSVALGICTFIFLLYALGSHVAQTAYLALVTDLTPQRERTRAVAFLWTALILGQITSSFVISYWLSDYTPMKLVQVMQTSSIVFLACAIAAIWKQDQMVNVTETEGEDDFTHRVWSIVKTPRIRLFFLTVFLGTIGLTEQDVLMEPYAGQVLGMTVGETSRITGFWGIGMLVAMLIAARVVPRLSSPLPVAMVSCTLGLCAMVVVIGVSVVQSVPMLLGGVMLVGLSNGLFLISTLSLVVSMADIKTAGLFVGMWGLCQTTGTGLSNIVGGAVRDAFTTPSNPVAGYVAAYTGEMLLLCVAFVLLLSIPRGSFATSRGQSAFAGLTDLPGA
jgi:BCD family chlorophyll transporter-like MFS transporter